MGWAYRSGMWHAALGRPELLAIQPVVMFVAHWVGGETALLALAVGLPVLLIAVILLCRRRGAIIAPDGDLALRPHILRALDDAISGAGQDLAAACIVVQIDDAPELLDQHGRTAQTRLMAQATDRLCRALRHDDVVARLEGGGFAIALAPTRRLDIEALIQLAVRLQMALAVPLELDAARIAVTCSVGVCPLDRAPLRSAHSLLDAAQIAAEEASRHGPAAIRAFSTDIAQDRTARDTLRDALEQALDTGQIRAHFQPQISTDTGTVTGFETLARWYHPTRGVVPPSEFLPAIETAGLSGKLAEVMLRHGLVALKKWDAAGLSVPTIAVNFSASELRDPTLVEKMRWEFDRHDLCPSRLSVEILETVVARCDNDPVVRNITELSRMGCGIDLDDFGTGYASITNIRRFAVRRLKIDRSFVSRIDKDRDQQRLIEAILSLADRLGLGTLAEGVEEEGEKAMLSRLGCRQLQGFGIARPMPFEETLAWIASRHARAVANPTQL